MRGRYRLPMRIDAAALRRSIELINGRPMTRRERAVLARFLLLGKGCRGSVDADTFAGVSTPDDRTNPLSMNAPVPTGRTEGERKFLSVWGQALEKVGRRHEDLPAIRRGQRLQEANTESPKQSDAE